MQVQGGRSVRRVQVMADGKNLVSHVGTTLLAEVADRSGLTRATLVAMGKRGISWHTHDSGVALTDLAVAIIDGAHCLAHLSVLREQEDWYLRYRMQARPTIPAPLHFAPCPVAASTCPAIRRRTPS